MSFLLLFVFLGTTSGVSVYKHYCGDFLAEISIFIQSNPCSDENGEDACTVNKEMECCDDETDFYQLEIDLVKTSLNKINFSLNHGFTLLGHINKLDTKDEIAELSYLERPPPIYRIPIYKELQRFTLYG